MIGRMSEKFIRALGAHNLPGLRGLIDGFNYYDVQRVAEIGADRAAAEWVVRCGGKIKFDKYHYFIDDYNQLIRLTSELDPEKPGGIVRLTNIDGTNSSLSGYGCRHLKGLNSLVELRFVECKNMKDLGLKFAGDSVSSTLKFLEITKCPRITDDGIEYLAQFSGLNFLILSDLKGVYKPERCHDVLKAALPNCEITFKY